MTREKDNKTKRDNNLDIYRGCAMIYIVGFMHIIGYWIDPHTNDILSMTAIVMPMIFYISGAPYALSGKKNYGEYLLKRIKRIIIPLVVYVAIYSIYNTLNGEIALQQLPGTILSYLYNPIVTGKTMGLGHLWYIQPYLIIALLLPLMYYISLHIKQYGSLALLLATMIGIYLYPNYVLCYIVPTFAGLYYMRDKPYNSLAVLLMFVAAMVLWVAQGNIWNIQINKFPPTLMYLAYTSCMLIIFSKPLKWLCRQATHIAVFQYFINQYAQHSYCIYLYHINVIKFIHTIYFIICLKFFDNHPFLMHPACSLTVIATSTLVLLIPLCKIIDPINNAITKVISALWHKATSLYRP